MPEALTQYLVKYLNKGEEKTALKTDDWQKADLLLKQYVRFGKVAWIDVLWNGKPIDEMTEAEMVGFSEYDEMAPRPSER